MNSTLPRYKLHGEQVEAFKITAIEFPDIGVRLCGPNDLIHGVRKTYIRDHAPYVGGYYIRVSGEYEYFLEDAEFEMYYRPVRRATLVSSNTKFDLTSAALQTWS